MNTYKFWGTTRDGERDLLGLCNAGSIGEALSCWPSVVTDMLKEYTKIEIVQAGAGPHLVDAALLKLPKLRRVK